MSTFLYKKTKKNSNLLSQAGVLTAYSHLATSMTVAQSMLSGDGGAADGTEVVAAEQVVEAK